MHVTHDQTEAITLGDRIVIMKDGYIQQIGTPQDVFNHPANLFVAGFIGTPVMNFFDAQFTREGSKCFVEIGGLKVELSEDKEERLLKNDVQSRPSRSAFVPSTPTWLSRALPLRSRWPK